MNVLIVADTRRSPEMRHEVPLMIPDPFLYAEVDGSRHVAVAALERRRIEALGLGIEVTPFEELGIDELARGGRTQDEVYRELHLSACRAFGLEEALVSAEFPASTADYLRAEGVTLTADPEHFRNRRRVRRRPSSPGSVGRNGRPRPPWRQRSLRCAERRLETGVSSSIASRLRARS